jgi:pimeloyl-ACP methyl ester carboxylesterase
MRTRFTGGLIALISAAMLLATTANATPNGRINDEQCVPSSTHPHAVVLLHGLAANRNEDINKLQSHLAGRGYCTFSVTYGAYPLFPNVGGLASLDSSADQIAAFIDHIATITGRKVDLVGHSEGAFESLYVAKQRPAVTGKISSIAAIAPPTHDMDPSTGTVGKLSPELLSTVLGAVGCQACAGLSAAQARLTNGPVAQPGIDYTILTSTHDKIAAPPAGSFVHEPGVHNEYVQDSCPLDPVGHIGEPYDSNVWQLVENALDPAHAVPPNPCATGLPF